MKRKIPEGVVTINKRGYLVIPKWLLEKIKKFESCNRRIENGKITLEFTDDGYCNVFKKRYSGVVCLRRVLPGREETKHYEARFDDGTLLIDLEGEVEI